MFCVSIADESLYLCIDSVDNCSCKANCPYPDHVSEIDLRRPDIDGVIKHAFYQSFEL